MAAIPRPTMTSGQMVGHAAVTKARRDDGDIGKDVIARRQEGGSRQAADGGASPARWMKCYRRT